MVLNKIFNEKCIEQLVWRGYEEYQRLIKRKVSDFNDLSEWEREAFIGMTDRILELAIWEVERKLYL